MPDAILSWEVNKMSTGKERVIAALKGQYTDAVPVSVMLGFLGAKLAGFTQREFLTDVNKCVKSQLTAYERFKPDTMYATFGTLVIPEALGNELEFPVESASRTKVRFLEDKANFSKLKIPDPKRDKRLPGYLEICERVNSAVTGSTVGSSCAGPWNLAAELRGLEQLIFDTIDDPDFVHNLMRFTTEVVNVVGSAVRETDIGLGIAEASASCSVISPKMYREFVKPYHQGLVDYFKERKTWLSLHICGYTDPIMEDLVSEGYSSLSIDSPSSLRKMVQVSQKKVTVVGNVSTILFAQGSKEEIEAAVKECLRIAAPGSR